MGRQLVPLPVVVSGIHYPVLGAAGQVAAGAGRRPAIIVGAQLDAATIRIQQHLVGIEAGAVVGAPGALDAIGVALPQPDPLYMDVPVVGGAVEAGERGITSGVASSAPANSSSSTRLARRAQMAKLTPSCSGVAPN